MTGPDWSDARRALEEGRARDLMGFRDIAAQGLSFPYLATPFSALERRGDGAWAAQAAAATAMRFAAEGVTVFAPIVLSVAMCRVSGCPLRPLDDEFWTNWCAPALARCDAVIVADIAGWAQSHGCAREASVAVGDGAARDPGGWRPDPRRAARVWRPGIPLFFMGDGAEIGVVR